MNLEISLSKKNINSFFLSFRTISTKPYSTNKDSGKQNYSKKEVLLIYKLTKELRFLDAEYFCENFIIITEI